MTDRATERFTLDAHAIQVHEPVAVPAGARSGGVLLLNGAGLRSSGWDGVIDELKSSRVVTVDRPPRRGGPRERLPSLAAEVAVLRRLLRALGRLRPPGHAPMVVVAHSMAAFQAEALARTAPEHVASVVLVDPSVEVAGTSGLHTLSAAAQWAAELALRASPVRALARRGLRAGLRAQTRHPYEIDADSWRRVWSGDRARLGAAAAEWLSYRGQVAELERLRARLAGPAPVRVTVLEVPPYSGRPGQAVLRSAFADVDLRRMPGSRHLMMIDAVDEIIQAIRALAPPT